MGNDRPQRRVGWAGESDLKGLIILIHSIVYHGDTDVGGGHTRGEGQRPVGQRVIDTATTGRAAHDRVVHSHCPAGGRGEGDRQIGRADVLRSGGTGGIKGDQGRRIVVGDDRRDLLLARFGAIHHGRDVHDDGFVVFIQRILHRSQRD